MNLGYKPVLRTVKQGGFFYSLEVSFSFVEMTFLGNV